MEHVECMHWCRCWKTSRGIVVLMRELHRLFSLRGFTITKSFISTSPTWQLFFFHSLCKSQFFKVNFRKRKLEFTAWMCYQWFCLFEHDPRRTGEHWNHYKWDTLQGCPRPCAQTMPGLSSHSVINHRKIIFLNSAWGSLNEALKPWNICVRCKRVTHWKRSSQKGCSYLLKRKWKRIWLILTMPR